MDHVATSRTATAQGHLHEHAHHEELGFLRKYVFSQDHKVIGIQYAITGLLFLLFGFVLMMIMRWQLAYPMSPIPIIGGWLGTANAPGGHAPPAAAAPAPAPQRAPSAPAPAPTAGQIPSSRPGRDPETVDANAPRALAAFLVSYEGSELGSFYPIHQGQNLVGRKGAAAAGGLNIELEHGTTSSRHAMILASARPGRVKIEDVGSTNGTFVGDLMLERGKKHELKDGDVVRFGGYVTIVKII